MVQVSTGQLVDMLFQEFWGPIHTAGVDSPAARSGFQ